jgi:hypothetical protein
MKVVRLLALRTGRLYPPVNIPRTHFCYRLSQPQGPSAAERIMSIKNYNDTIGIRTRDLPTCNAVPQPTAPPRTPIQNRSGGIITRNIPPVLRHLETPLEATSCDRLKDKILVDVGEHTEASLRKIAAACIPRC